MTTVHGPDAVVVDEARRVHADVVVLPGTTTPAILRRFRGAVLIVPECARLPRRAWPSRSVAATVGRGVHRRARIALGAVIGAAAVPVMVIRVGSPARIRIRAVRRAA